MIRVLAVALATHSEEWWLRVPQPPLSMVSEIYLKYSLKEICDIGIKSVIGIGRTLVQLPLNESLKNIYHFTRLEINKRDRRHHLHSSKKLKPTQENDTRW